MQYGFVPNIISGKDLDYLSDMFNWNYGAYKSTYNSISQVKDKELAGILNNASDMFKSNINKVLSILKNGGANE